MKLLQNSTLQAYLLMCVLSLYACSFAKELLIIHSWNLNQAVIAKATDDMPYDHPAGIDVYSRPLGQASLSVKRYVVFVLHNNSLREDIQFWGGVNKILSSHQEIALVGYCDSDRCIESTHKIPALGFTVLTSGEVVSVQGVIDADASGKAIIKRVGAFTQREIPWRRSDISPEKIAREVVQ